MQFHEIPSTLQITVPPAAEPLTAADLHAQLRLDNDEEDDLIDEWIQTAREMVELDTRRALVIQTRTLYADQFAYFGRLDRSDNDRDLPPGALFGGEIELRCPPIAAVNSVKCIDAAGDLQTVDEADYLVDLVTEPGRLYPAFGKSWPVTRWQANAVQIECVAGYATPFTVNASTDVLTLQGRTVTDGSLFQLSNAGGDLPAGLSVRTNYYVISSTGSTCKLSLTAGGSPIDITGTGTGTHFLGVIPGRALQAIRLLVAHWYRHREAVGTVADEVNFAYTRLIRSLLWTLPC